MAALKSNSLQVKLIIDEFETMGNRCRRQILFVLIWLDVSAFRSRDVDQSVAQQLLYEGASSIFGRQRDKKFSFRNATSDRTFGRIFRRLDDYRLIETTMQQRDRNQRLRYLVLVTLGSNFQLSFCRLHWRRLNCKICREYQPSHKNVSENCSIGRVFDCRRLHHFARKSCIIEWNGRS